MGKIVLYIAASLDGFIAGEGEDLTWLDRVEGQGDNGYEAFYSGVDILLMGRKTYDWIMANAEFPYAGKDCFVFTHEPRENRDDVTFVSGDAAAIVSRLKEQTGKTIWLVGGGGLLKPLLEAGLVDEMILTIAPVVLGKGIPLFHEMEGERNLVLTGMAQYGQFAQLRYQATENTGRDICFDDPFLN